MDPLRGEMWWLLFLGYKASHQQEEKFSFVKQSTWMEHVRGPALKSISKLVGLEGLSPT